MCSAERLLSIYPTVSHAVAYCELMLFDGPDGGGWLLVSKFRKGTITIDEAFQLVKDVCQDSIDEGEPGHLREALAEMDRPEFRPYFAGKFGLL